MLSCSGDLHVDVAVVGAGSAGVAAAISAAESGARTLLIEASGAVGGTLAWQLLEHSAGFHDQHGNQVVGGVGQRLIERLRAAGGTPGHIRDDVGYTATRTPVNHAELALVEAVMLGEAGAMLWLHTPLVAVESGPRRIEALIVESPAGRVRVRPQVAIDTSGDAVLCRRAGARFHQDAEDCRQPASLTFKLGGVDFAALLAYARANPDDFRAGSIIGSATDSEVNLWGFGQLLASGYARGQLSLRRTELHLAGWPRRGEAIVNVTRATAGPPQSNWTGEAVSVLSRQVLEFASWFRTSVPGCANAYVAAIANRIGVRESGRVEGVYTMTRDDLVARRRFADAIAQGAFPIDIHESGRPSLSHTEQLGGSFDIPYGCLVARDFDNLLVAGRCLSSTHEANGSLRITATCFATGEAAGTAAALAARAEGCATHIDIDQLRRMLRDRGGVLHA